VTDDVEATPHPEQTGVADLERLLNAHSDDDAAARALLVRWQADPALAPRLANCPFRFDAGGLYCVNTRGTLGQLSVLDRPVLLGIPHAGRLRWIALLRLDSETATVDIGGVEAVLERAQLESRWPGEYRAPMRLPEDVGAVQAAALPDWARQALTRFEANRTLPPLSNDDDRIRRLQQDHGLRADSIIGPETWWVMSAQLDGGPRLRSSMPIDASR
jgi:general secretion pathway protein A